MAIDLTLMQDISLDDKDLYAQWEALMAVNNVTDAIALIAANPELKYKVLDKANMDRIANAICVDSDSLEQKFLTKYDLLETASENYVYLGEWEYPTSYSLGNFVTYDDVIYFALYYNDGCQPDTDEDNWIAIYKSRTPNGVYISETAPEGYLVGDRWKKIIGTF
jgi:hypothetical protein